MWNWLKNLWYSIIPPSPTVVLQTNGNPIKLLGGGPDPVAGLEASCVAHFKMNDNAASTVVINSKGTTNGTAQQNTNLIHTIGKVGGGLLFNGTSDYIDTKQTFQSVFQDSFSINIWFQTNDGQPSPSSYTLFGAEDFYETGQNEYTVSINLTHNGRLNAAYAVILNGSDTEINLSSTPPLPNGINSLIMVTMIVTKISTSQARMMMHINGVLNNGSNIVNISMGSYAGNRNLFLGSVYNFISLRIQDFFNGSLDNFMIFNRALNSEEIALLYNSGRGTEDFQLSDNLNTTGENLLAMVGV